MSTVNEARRVAVRKYFMKTPQMPTLAIVLMVLGGLSILVGLVGMVAVEDAGPACLGTGGCLGLILIIVGGAQYLQYRTAYQAAEPKPSDAQMDAWLEADKSRFRAEALAKLDLVADQIVGDPNDPITVIGPRPGAMARVGNDGVIRFSAYDYLVVYLTQYHLAAYQVGFDFHTALPASESTKEYHYTDVVSVSTQTESSGLFAITWGGQQRAIALYQKFALSVASGEKIEVTIGFPQAQDIVQHGRLAATGADKAIATIRAMLREKKGGTPG